jgi:hypothetical protein
MRLLEAPCPFDAMFKGAEDLELFSRKFPCTTQLQHRHLWKSYTACDEQVLIGRMLDGMLMIRLDPDRYDSPLVRSGATY